MNILIAGSGGREHALAWKIKQSAHCSNLFIAPGNAGTATVGTNVPIAVTDFDALASFNFDLANRSSSASYLFFGIDIAFIIMSSSASVYLFNKYYQI